MEVSYRFHRFAFALILTIPAAALLQSAYCQGTNDKPAATQAGKPDSTAPHRVRVVADLSQFHLDKLPADQGHPNTIGAGSRGGPGSKITLCAPALGVSGSTHPSFHWKVAGSPGGNTFSLVNSDGDVLYENDVTGTSFQYPTDAPPLVPGETYSWKVSGSGMEGIPAPVQIEIQTKRTTDEVQAKLAGDAASDPLERAQVFMHSGLWYDAVTTLEEGIHTHPDRKDLSEQLHVMYKQIVPSCQADSAP